MTVAVEPEEARGHDPLAPAAMARAADVGGAGETRRPQDPLRLGRLMVMPSPLGEELGGLLSLTSA